METSGYVSDAQVRRKHRRAVLLQLVLPVALVTAAMIALLVIMVLALSPRGFNVVASCMSLWILVPTVLLCLIPYVLVVAVFGGTRKLYLWLPDKLQVARHALHRVNTFAQEASVRVTKPVIAVSGRLAWVEQIVNGKPSRPESKAESKAVVASGKRKPDER